MRRKTHCSSSQSKLFVTKNRGEVRSKSNSSSSPAAAASAGGSGSPPAAHTDPLIAPSSSSLIFHIHLSAGGSGSSPPQIILDPPQAPQSPESVILWVWNVSKFSGQFQKMKEENPLRVIKIDIPRRVGRPWYDRIKGEMSNSNLSCNREDKIHEPWEEVELQLKGRKKFHAGQILGKNK